MLRKLSLLAFGLVVALPASAQTFRAENRIYVTAVADGFTVPNGGGFGARGMWCAAADYARDVAGASGTQRLYVAEKSKRVAVRFTLSDAGLVPSSVVIVGGSVRVAGANLSVDHAQSFCADAKLINR